MCISRREVVAKAAHRERDQWKELDAVNENYSIGKKATLHRVS